MAAATALAPARVRENSRIVNVLATLRVGFIPIAENEGGYKSRYAGPSHRVAVRFEPNKI